MRSPLDKPERAEISLNLVPKLRLNLAQDVVLGTSRNMIERGPASRGSRRDG